MCKTSRFVQNQIALHPKSKQHHSLYILFLRLEKFSRALIETTNTLNWFDDYAGNISFFNSASTRSTCSMAKVTICCALIGATIFLLSVVATAADVRP
jgi:hypothetical protein